jgi:hypothetical protein
MLFISNLVFTCASIGSDVGDMRPVVICISRVGRVRNPWRFAVRFCVCTRGFNWLEQMGGIEFICIPY